MSYTIWCLISGEDNEFHVKLDESNMVAHLKEIIKVTCQLASMDAKKLTLYHINLKLSDEAGAPPLHNTIKMMMKELKEKGESPLHPIHKVRKYYPAGLDDNMVQIFVQLPESESTKTPKPSDPMLMLGLMTDLTGDRWQITGVVHDRFDRK